MAIQTFNSVDGFSVGNSQITVIDGVANVSANSLSVSGNANISATTASTSKTTGALTVAGGLGVAGTSYNNRSVTQGAYGNIILNEFTGIYNQKDSGTSLIQTTTNALSSGVGIQVTGAAGNGSQLYSTGTMEIAVGVAVRSEDVPTGGTVIASIASTGVSVTGNISATGNITGNYFIGNGSQLTDLPAGGIEYVYKTSAYTVTANQGVLADTAGGAFTVTLPATPATGDQCVVADAGGVFGTNNCTVARNGSTIAGIAQDLALDIDGVSVQLVYDGTTWEVYSQVGGAGGTASAYGNTQVTAYLEAGISGNINPSANVTYSLGNVDRQWSELWVANSTIYIGGIPLSVTGNVLFVNDEPVLSNDSTTNISTSGNISSANITATGAITNSRIVIRVVSTTSGSSLTINGDTTDQYEVTALAESATINEPTGTPTDGQRLTIRIDDNGSAQSLSWNSIFRVIGTTLPATTVAGKTVYVGCIYNDAKTKWDVVSVAQEA